MNVLLINSGAYGSTGGIAKSLYTIGIQNGFIVHIACPDNRKYPSKSLLNNYANKYIISNILYRKIMFELTKTTGFDGAFCVVSTLRLCRYIISNNIELIHLHNLHTGYLNLHILFGFLKKHPNIKVIWTLHDCWSFTGHCPHFTMAKCDKWKTGCHDCPQYKEYPKSLIDNSSFMWKLKKKWFTGVKNMTIVTPSGWLAGLVMQSYLKDYPVKVINNGIDLNVFKPTSGDFKRDHGIPQAKYIILGVSFGWGIKKGLDVFVELSKRLDDEKYQIVLVGTNEKNDEQLPDNIISIHCTQNQKELAVIYSAADLFVNPTREENFPTVNMESLACGTPVLTFKTGGSPEIIDETCGSVVDCDNVESLESEIRRICTEHPYSRDMCLARAEIFNKDRKFREYMDLYEKVVL